MVNQLPVTVSAMEEMSQSTKRKKGASPGMPQYLYRYALGITVVPIRTQSESTAYTYGVG